MAHPDPDAGTEGAESRRLTSVFLCVFLGVQVLLPLSYYVGRPDPRDDRFAWRMFNDDVMKGCEVQATRDGEAIDLSSELEVSWLVLLGRQGGARRQPVKALERHLCRTSETGRASVRIVCYDHARELVVPWAGEPVTCEVAP